MMRVALLSAISLTLSGCVGNPDFDLRVKDSEYGSAVFRIASIMANVKCELWEAANSEQELPSFHNDTDLRRRETEQAEPDRVFNLKNIFSTIAYVGEMSITLDATERSGVSPSAHFFGWGSDARPLSVDAEASLSGVGHRESTTYHSVDFERLVQGGRRSCCEASRRALPDRYRTERAIENRGDSAGGAGRQRHERYLGLARKRVEPGSGKRRRWRQVLRRSDPRGCRLHHCEQHFRRSDVVASPFRGSWQGPAERQPRCQASTDLHVHSYLHSQQVSAHQGDAAP